MKEALLTCNESNISIQVRRINRFTFMALCDDGDSALHLLGLDGFKILWYDNSDYVVKSFDSTTKMIIVSPRQTIGPYSSSE